MPGKPERLDVLAPDRLDHRRDDVLEVAIVFGGPDAARRERRGDDEAVLVGVVEQWKVVALPVAVRAAAVEAQDERDLLASFQVAGIVEKVGAARLRLDDGAAAGDDVGRASLVGTMLRRRAHARSSRHCQRLRQHAGCRNGDDGEHESEQAHG